MNELITELQPLLLKIDSLIAEKMEELQIHISFEVPKSANMRAQDAQLVIYSRRDICEKK